MDGRSDQAKIHIIIPWFDCNSISGYRDGSYGNCLYHIEGNKYSYTVGRLLEFPDVRGWRAKWDNAQEPRKLNRQNSPIRGGNLIDLPEFRLAQFTGSWQRAAPTSVAATW